MTVQAPPYLRQTPARKQIVDGDVEAILSEDLPWSSFKDSVVLISGASGFLAAYMVETLLAMHHRFGFGPAKVIAMVRTIANGEARFEHHKQRKELEILGARVEERLAIDGPVDFIVHAASNASPRTFLTDPVGILDANLAGTANLLGLARAKAARLLLFSSGEVYGQTQRVPTREQDYGVVDPVAVRSCYAESKRAAETMCACWSHQFAVDARIVRPFHTYGPGVSLEDGRVFADFVSDIVHGRDIVMKSDGSARRAFCYVADATSGFFTVLLKGEPALPYNIGNEEAEVSIRELADILVSLFPEKNLKVTMDCDARDSNYAVSPISRNAPSIVRARQLGWMPRTSIREGFQKMILSYA